MNEQQVNGVPIPLEETEPANGGDPSELAEQDLAFPVGTVPVPENQPPEAEVSPPLEEINATASHPQIAGEPDEPQDEEMTPLGSAGAEPSEDELTGGEPEVLVRESRSPEAIRESVAELERRVPPETRGSQRDFWDLLRSTRSEVRTCSPETLPDRADLEQRLAMVGETAQEQRKDARRQAVELRATLQNALAIARDELDHVAAISDVQQLRSDMGLLRERLDREGRILDRRSREQIWAEWQAANAATWEALNRFWTANAEVLAEAVGAARAFMDAGKVREAREAVRAFHALLPLHETSHRTLRELRAAGEAVWREAQEAGKERHQAYLQNAAHRVQGWRAAQARLNDTRRTIEREISRLEADSAGAGTEIAAALLRGRLTERRKALAELDARERDLSERIAATEKQLNEG